MALTHVDRAGQLNEFDDADESIGRKKKLRGKLQEVLLNWASLRSLHIFMYIQ